MGIHRQDPAVWTIVEGDKELRTAQDRFRSGLTALAEQSVSCRAGYQGGHLDVNAYWIPDRRIWFAHRVLNEEPVPRYWNAFGTRKPSPNAMMHIVCEINLAINGVDGRVAGVLVKDERGRYHISHRGRIGGGREGIGKTTFFRHFGGEKFRIRENGLETELAYVCEIGTPDLLARVSYFVHEVERIKDLAVA